MNRYKKHLYALILLSLWVGLVLIGWDFSDIRTKDDKLVFYSSSAGWAFLGYISGWINE